MSSKMPFGGQKLNQHLGHVHTTTLAKWEDNRCNANCSWSAKIGKHMNVNKHQLIKAINGMWISSSTRVGWLPACKQKQVIACLASGKGVYTHMEGLIPDAISKCSCNICTGLVSFSGIPYLEGKIWGVLEEPQHLSWNADHLDHQRTTPGA